MKTMAKDNSLLQQEQVERLLQIGAYLRHVREENGLSLETVAAQTMIQPRLLKAIEEGKLHHLPEPVYVQGFIRRYAEALSLDGVEFAEAFPAERSLHVAESWKDSPAAQLRPLHLYIAYIALIMASVGLLSYIVGRPTTTGSVANVRTNTTTTVPSVAPSADVRAAVTDNKKTDRPAATRSEIPSKPVQVDLKLTSQSWLEVEVDGEVKLAEVLPEGTERTWTADKQVRVRAGNAGGVLVAHNGGKATQMGAPGAVEEKTFTPVQDTADASANSSSTSDSEQEQ